MVGDIYIYIYIYIRIYNHPIGSIYHLYIAFWGVMCYLPPETIIQSKALISFIQLWGGMQRAGALGWSQQGFWWWISWWLQDFAGTYNPLLTEYAYMGWCNGCHSWTYYNKLPGITFLSCKLPHKSLTTSSQLGIKTLKITCFERKTPFSKSS